MIIKAIKETLGQMFYSPEATGSWVIEEEDIECAIDDQIVDCSKVDSTPYIGVPAPAYLEDDEWFGPAIKSEKQMTHEEMLEVAYQRETELTVDDALEELAYIVQGGQDAEEFQQSIRVIAQVLEQYK